MASSSSSFVRAAEAVAGAADRCDPHDLMTVGTRFIRLTACGWVVNV